MAKIHPQAMSAVVELSDSEPNSETMGWEPLPIIGTGFLYGLKADENGAYTFLVTAKHVVNNLENIWLRFNTSDGKLGQYHEIRLENEKGRWMIDHPASSVDVAVYPISMDTLRKHGLESLFLNSETNALNRKKAKEAGLYEGDNVIVLGFPLALSGHVRKSVTARGGIIARIQDFLDGDDQYFLIDSQAFPGNSGGPVFNVPAMTAIAGTKAVQNSYLIGMVSSYLPHKLAVIDKESNEVRELEVENSGLVIVEPVDHINEAIIHAVQVLKSLGIEP